MVLFVSKPKQIRLAINLLASGRHNAAWKTLDDPAGLPTDIDVFVQIARTAERGLLDGVFLADNYAGLTTARRLDAHTPACPAAGQARPQQEEPAATAAPMTLTWSAAATARSVYASGGRPPRPVRTPAADVNPVFTTN